MQDSTFVTKILFNHTENSSRKWTVCQCALCNPSDYRGTIPFFPATAVQITPKLQKMVVVEAPFLDELSGMAMVTIFDMKEQSTNMIKLKFIRNKAMLKITNKTHETITFSRTEMMGIVDLRSLGFYKIKQEVLQEHLGRHYHFKLADDICDQYNRFVNFMRKEEENSEGKFP